MLHGSSADGVGLGAVLGEPVTVEKCQRDTGMTAADCQRLLLELVDAPNGYAIIARAALMAYGTYKCAAILQAEGVPLMVGTPACSWAVQKVGQGIDYLWRFVSDSGPTIYTLRKGTEGIFWRKIDNPSQLEPGETFFPKGTYGIPYSWAELNLAILKQGGAAARIALLPCARLPYTTGWSPSGKAPGQTCRDIDGTVRPMKVTKPFYQAAFYKNEDDFPDLPPPTGGGGATPQRMTVGPLMNIISSTPTYPAGSITAFDPKVGGYRIAAPLGLAGGAAYHEVAVAPSKPAGVTEVPLPTYQEQTGTRPWYASWKLWAGVGAVAVAGAGAAVALRRRRRR